MKKILVIEDDEGIRSNILDLLDAEGFQGVGADNGVTGVSEALRARPDVVICDIGMPELDGYGVLEALRDHEETATVPFIFLTARAERADMRAGMNLGADDYLTKPFTRTELLEAIQTRLRRQQAVIEKLTNDADTIPASKAPVSRAKKWDVIVRSPSMKALYVEAGQAAQANLSVLILGETGVGKEVLAHEIHNKSRRASGPFVPLNCAALSETLLESELFGHEKGAFTGATQSEAGLFETAHGGTVFLDEIGELAPAIQAKLLRVLEDRQVLRVGSRKARNVDVRFIVATNRDLSAEVEAGNFRRDLFFRINGITMNIPPLRERVQEIEPLAKQFVAASCRAIGRNPLPRVDPETLVALEQYAFPGNVRELKNHMERSVALCQGDVLLPQHLPADVTAGAQSAPPSTPMEQLREEMADLEKQRIITALETCGGNQTKAAEMLGISRRTLVSRLDAYNLPRPRKKRG